MANENITTENFRVNAFDVDFNKELLFEVLGRNILNSADINSEAAGHGMVEMSEENRSWVISRFTVEMFRMPKVTERYSIETWFESFYRMFANRNSAIKSQDGGMLGYVRTVYSVIDNDTRQPVEFADLYGEAFAPMLCPDKPCEIEGHSHICPLTGVEAVSTFRPMYNDLDCNGHFNSVKYIVHLLNLFPKNLYETHVVRRVEIAYVAEAYYGEELSFYLCETGPLLYQAEIRRCSGSGDKQKTIARALITFATRQ